MSFFSTFISQLDSLNFIGNKDAWEKSGLCPSHTLPFLNDFKKSTILFTRSKDQSMALKKCAKTLYLCYLRENHAFWPPPSKSALYVDHQNAAPQFRANRFWVKSVRRRWNRKRKKKKRVKKKVNFQDIY